MNALKTCSVCGKGLPTDAPSHRRYCSRQCRCKAADRRKRGYPVTTPERQCPACGKALTGRIDRIYCSPQCSARARDRMRGGHPVATPDRTCQVCGRPLRPGALITARFCSEACASAARYRRNRGSPPDGVFEKVCPVCKAAFTARRHDKTYCSRTCIQTARTRRAKGIPIATPAHRECPVCGTTISRDRPLRDDNFCSKECWHLGRRLALRDEVFAAYGGACECCGQSDPEVLCIDHVYGGGKAHRASLPGGLIQRWLKSEGFPRDGFRLLCQNCNAGRSRTRGACPHEGVPLPERLACARCGGELTDQMAVCAPCRAALKSTIGSLRANTQCVSCGSEIRPSEVGVCFLCAECAGSRSAVTHRYFHFAHVIRALSHYAGDPPRCANCGESNYYFLTLDHVRGEGAEHRRKVGSLKLAHWLEKNGYPDGFQVLYWNCNWKKGARLSDDGSLGGGLASHWKPVRVIGKEGL